LRKRATFFDAKISYKKSKKVSIKSQNANLETLKSIDVVE